MSDPSTPDAATVEALLDREHVELVDAISAFATETLARLEVPIDDATARSQARRILELLGAAGWCRYAVPEAFGGARPEVDPVACCLIRETLASVSPLADSVFALQCLGSLPITLFGSQELKQQWLPGVASGDAMAAFAMTELEAGSDVKAMATRADRDAGSYAITGSKAYITNAGLADFYTTFARTSEDGLSTFVVPADTEGLEFVEAQILSAPHPLGKIAFERCAVPVTARVGSEGEGFEVGMATLDRLRPTVAAAACGMAGRALAEGRSHALRRRQFGRELSRFQLIQQKLARMATELTAARLLTYRAARAIMDGEADLKLRSAMAKVHATETAQSVVDDAVQILGGSGVLAGHPVDHLYRSVRALRIYEGTSEIQQLVIARELLRGSTHDVETARAD